MEGGHFLKGTFHKTGVFMEGPLGHGVQGWQTPRGKARKSGRSPIPNKRAVRKTGSPSFD